MVTYHQEETNRAIKRGSDFCRLAKKFHEAASEWEREGVCLICVEREGGSVLAVNSLT